MRPFSQPLQTPVVPIRTLCVVTSRTTIDMAGVTCVNRHSLSMFLRVRTRHTGRMPIRENHMLVWSRTHYVSFSRGLPPTEATNCSGIGLHGESILAPRRGFRERPVGGRTGPRPSPWPSGLVWPDNGVPVTREPDGHPRRPGPGNRGSGGPLAGVGGCRGCSEGREELLGHVRWPAVGIHSESEREVGPHEHRRGVVDLDVFR